MKLIHSVAQIVAKIAEREAEKVGVPMAIAIADNNGSMVHFTFMDATLPVSREIAVSKAYTAAVLRMSTRTVGELSLPGHPLYGIQNTHQGKLILFGGGFPLCRGDQVIGSIGVSGGSVEEDEQVAAPAVESFNTMINCAEIVRQVLPKAPMNKVRVHTIENIVRQRVDADEQIAAVVTGAILLAAR